MATTQLLLIRKVWGSGAYCRIGSGSEPARGLKRFFGLGTVIGLMQTGRPSQSRVAPRGVLG